MLERVSPECRELEVIEHTMRYLHNDMQSSLPLLKYNDNCGVIFISLHITLSLTSYGLKFLDPLPWSVISGACSMDFYLF